MPFFDGFNKWMLAELTMTPEEERALVETLTKTTYHDVTSPDTYGLFFKMAVLTDQQRSDLRATVPKEGISEYQWNVGGNEVVNLYIASVKQGEKNAVTLFWSRAD